MTVWLTGLFILSFWLGFIFFWKGRARVYGGAFKTKVILQFSNVSCLLITGNGRIMMTTKVQFYSLNVIYDVDDFMFLLIFLFYLFIFFWFVINYAICLHCSLCIWNVSFFTFLNYYFFSLNKIVFNWMCFFFSCDSLVCEIFSFR